MLDWQDIEIDDALRLRVVAGAEGIRAIDLHGGVAVDGEPNGDNPLLHETARQLRAYFDGKLRQFDVPLDLQGTEFQRRVWHHLETIPYGETRSYAQIAAAIGSPRAVRA